MEDLGEMSGCVVCRATSGRHNRSERNTRLVDLGLTEETWTGGAARLEMAVQRCVDGLRYGREIGVGW